MLTPVLPGACRSVLAGMIHIYTDALVGCWGWWGRRGGMVATVKFLNDMNRHLQDQKDASPWSQASRLVLILPVLPWPSELTILNGKPLGLWDFGLCLPPRSVPNPQIHVSSNRKESLLWRGCEYWLRSLPRSPPVYLSEGSIQELPGL